MVDHILDLLWGHGLGMFRRFDNIGAESPNVIDQNLL